EIGVHDVFSILLGVGAGIRFCCLGLAGLIHGLPELHRGLGERIGLGLDVLGVVALGSRAQGSDRILNGLAILCRDLVAIVLEGLLGGMQQCLGLVLGLDHVAALLVGLGIRLGVLDHLLDVSVRQTARGLNADLVLLAGALVLGRDV